MSDAFVAAFWFLVALISGLAGGGLSAICQRFVSGISAICQRFVSEGNND